MSEEYTLDQLAKLVRMHPRTIRSYIQQGLIRGPDTMGRNARYGDHHLKRLKVIQTLKKDHHLSLGEIRRVVTMAGPDEDIQIQLVGRGPDSEVEPAPASALEYIRSRRNRRSQVKPPEERISLSAPLEEPVQSIPDQDHLTPLKTLLRRLQNDSYISTTQRRRRSEEWIRLEVTPDVEIHVRGQLPPEQMQDFEQLAELMRHILIGSKDHE